MKKLFITIDTERQRPASYYTYVRSPGDQDISVQVPSLFAQTLWASVPGTTAHWRDGFSITDPEAFWPFVDNLVHGWADSKMHVHKTNLRREGRPLRAHDYRKALHTAWGLEQQNLHDIVTMRDWDALLAYDFFAHLPATQGPVLVGEGRIGDRQFGGYTAITVPVVDFLTVQLEGKVEFWNLDRSGSSVLRLRGEDADDAEINLLPGASYEQSSTEGLGRRLVNLWYGELTAAPTLPVPSEPAPDGGAATEEEE